ARGSRAGTIHSAPVLRGPAVAVGIGGDGRRPADRRAARGPSGRRRVAACRGRPARGARHRPLRARGGAVVYVSLPEIEAEVRAESEAYERALVDNDVEAMQEAFWSSELVVRFGVNDIQYGAEAVELWRRSAEPLPPGRHTGPTVVVAFGRDAATVSTEF